MADFMETSHDAALQDRPKAFNRVGVDRADDVLANMMAIAVVDKLAREAMLPAEPMIARKVIRAEQTNLRGNCFFDESFDGAYSEIFDDAGNNISLPLDRADDCSLAAGPATVDVRAFVPMSVSVFAADVGLINFDNAAEFFDIFDQRRSDLVAHLPSGFVRTEAHVTENLHCAHALFTSEHEMRDAIPIPEWLIRVLEDRSGDVREPITVWGAFLALPVPFAGRQVIDGRITATRATDALGPAASDQIGATGIFVREHPLELSGGKLVDRSRSLRHDTPSTMEGYCHV